LAEQEDTDRPGLVVPKTVPGKRENAPHAPDSGANRRAVIAGLLVDLPEPERREVIAELAHSDRAAIARMLIRQEQQGDSPRQAGDHGS
jgi:hypothetical protein